MLELYDLKTKLENRDVYTSDIVFDLLSEYRLVNSKNSQQFSPLDFATPQYVKNSSNQCNQSIKSTPYFYFPFPFLHIDSDTLKCATYWKILKKLYPQNTHNFVK